MNENNDNNVIYLWGLMIFLIFGLLFFVRSLYNKYYGKDIEKHCLNNLNGLNAFFFLYGFFGALLTFFSFLYQSLISKILLNIETYNIQYDDYPSNISNMKRINKISLYFSILNLLFTLIFYITCRIFEASCCKKDNGLNYEKELYYTLNN